MVAGTISNEYGTFMLPTCNAHFNFMSYFTFYYAHKYHWNYPDFTDLDDVWMNLAALLHILLAQKQA